MGGWERFVMPFDTPHSNKMELIRKERMKFEKKQNKKAKEIRKKKGQKPLYYFDNRDYLTGLYY